MKISQQFLRPNKYTRPGLPLRRITAVAVHYAGDPGATAQNLHDYFNGTCIAAKRYASCHFVVGLSGEVLQLIPESEWSYCTNRANRYALSIETCHPDSTGKFTEASERSLIELVAYLCRRHGLDPEGGGLIRHYDVTGKVCPKYYVDHPALWTAFRRAAADCMAGKPYTLPSYGEPVGYSPAVCDTTEDFSIRRWAAYQFKVTSATRPSLIPGGSGLRQVASSHSGRDWFFKFQAVGPSGAGVGMYLNGAKKPAVVVTIR